MHLAETKMMDRERRQQDYMRRASQHDNLEVKEKERTLHLIRPSLDLPCWLLLY